jgi:hypothetical protein
MSGLLHLVNAKREEIGGQKAAIRIAYRSSIIRAGSLFTLDKYMSDRAPLFYRPVSAILEDLKAGHFMSAVSGTLSKLPTSQSFQESHFGEIVAAIFAEEVMGLRRLYSKLTLLSAENSNAYKMDLVMYDMKVDPVRIVFAEVKCSPKCAEVGKSAGHDKSCFADIFASMNAYAEKDREFDLAAARDQLPNIPVEDREKVRAALMPYSGAPFDYAAFAVIDTETYSEDEAQLLRTRKNKKQFEVDLLCVESFSKVAGNVFNVLKGAVEPFKGA